MSIEWKDSYKVGESAIDAQHIKLFEYINLFLDAKDKAALQRHAMQLYQYTREHFAHEERMMRELNFSRYHDHVAAHNVLISRLNEVSQSVGTDTLNMRQLEQFISDWALYHIPVEDGQLAAYLAERC